MISRRDASIQSTEPWQWRHQWHHRSLSMSLVLSDTIRRGSGDSVMGRVTTSVLPLVVSTAWTWLSGCKDIQCTKAQTLVQNNIFKKKYYVNLLLLFSFFCFFLCLVVSSLHKHFDIRWFLYKCVIFTTRCHGNNQKWPPKRKKLFAVCVKVIACLTNMTAEMDADAHYVYFVRRILSYVIFFVVLMNLFLI